MIRNLKYNPALDGIRALAIAEVIARHAFSSPVLGWGVGVEIFFTLSGYLITRMLLQQAQVSGSIDLKSFYFNRALRLMPPLWSLLLVLLIASPLAHHWKSLMEAWVMAATYLMNFNRAFAWLPEAFLGHIWSLAEQEQFYLLWPLFLLLTRWRHTLRYIIAFLIVALFWRLFLLEQGATIARVYNGLDTHLDSIFVGCGFALLSLPSRIKKYVCAAWFVWPALLLFGCFFLPYESTSVQLLGSPLTGLVAGCLIVATDHPVLRKIFSFSPLTFVGRISYALYLWHYPLIEIAIQRYGLKGMALLVPVALTFLLATLSYFSIEAYTRNIKRQLAHAVRRDADESDDPVRDNQALGQAF